MLQRVPSNYVRDIKEKSMNESKYMLSLHRLLPLLFLAAL